MSKYRSERGQTMVLTTLLIASLLGMAALVMDLGSWMRAQRDVQAVADAAALAGAQALPEDAGLAESLARDYVTKNTQSGPDESDSYVEQATVSFPDASSIKVHVARPTDGFFARVFGVLAVDVEADATARVAGIKSAQWVAPIVVNSQHPMLSPERCDPIPCSDPTEIELIHLHGPRSGDAAGAFGLLDLRMDGNGNPGESTLADWMLNGYGGWMDKGRYTSAPSANFNAHDFQAALDEHIRLGTEILFPVYDPPIVRGGSNAEYDIVGWVGFHPTRVEGGGSSATIHGYFVRYLAQGSQVDPSSGDPDFGARAIELIE